MEENVQEASWQMCKGDYLHYFKCIGKYSAKLYDVGWDCEKNVVCPFQNKNHLFQGSQSLLWHLGGHHREPSDLGELHQEPSDWGELQQKPSDQGDLNQEPNDQGELHPG